MKKEVKREMRLIHHYVRVTNIVGPTGECCSIASFLPKRRIECSPEAAIWLS